MKKVAVVTDSSATIPKELLEELDIHVVPLLLNLNGKIYHDGIDITPDEFYRFRWRRVLLWWRRHARQRKEPAWKKWWRTPHLSPEGCGFM